MKKILIILLIVPIIVFARLDIQKITSTLSNIKGHKQISFFNANKYILFGDKIKFTSKLNSADIILFSPKKLKSKITIVNSYKKLKLNKNSIGAIYLNKGRTQIVFIRERLSSHGLRLSSKFKKHLMYEKQLHPK